MLLAQPGCGSQWTGVRHGASFVLLQGLREIQAMECWVEVLEGRPGVL